MNCFCVIDMMPSSPFSAFHHPRMVIVLQIATTFVQFVYFSFWIRHTFHRFLLFWTTRYFKWNVMPGLSIQLIFKRSIFAAAKDLRHKLHQQSHPRRISFHYRLLPGQCHPRRTLYTSFSLPLPRMFVLLFPTSLPSLRIGTSIFPNHSRPLAWVRCWHHWVWHVATAKAWEEDKDGTLFGRSCISFRSAASASTFFSVLVFGFELELFIDTWDSTLAHDIPLTNSQVHSAAIFLFCQFEKNLCVVLRKIL